MMEARLSVVALSSKTKIDVHAVVADVSANGVLRKKVASIRGSFCLVEAS